MDVNFTPEQIERITQNSDRMMVLFGLIALAALIAAGWPSARILARRWWSGRSAA